MPKKKSAQAPKPCEHKKVEAASYGLINCVACGAPRFPERVAEYRLSERVVLSPGDLIRVRGIGLGVYHYAVLDTPSGVPNITFSELESGRWGKVRTVYPDIVRRAERKAAAR